MDLIWIDMETTGLYAYNDHILEVAAMRTSGVQIIDEESWVLFCPHQMGNNWVLETHKRNGLWDECLKSKVSLLDVEKELQEFIGDYIGPIAGFSPHFDMSFLKAQLPSVARLFTHRTFDASTLRAMIKEVNEDFPDKVAHRALDDLHSAFYVYIEANRLMQKGALS